MYDKPKVYNLIEGVKFYGQKGDAGIVPNIYFKLFDKLVKNINLNNFGKKFSIDDQDMHQCLINNGFYPHQYHVKNKGLIGLETYRKDKFNTLYIRSNA